MQIKVQNRLASEFLMKKERKQLLLVKQSHPGQNNLISASGQGKFQSACLLPLTLIISLGPPDCEPGESGRRMWKLIFYSSVFNSSRERKKDMDVEKSSL